MSTALDLPAYAKKKAVSQIAAQNARQKQRIAESKAKEKARANAIRANGVVQVDIFAKKVKQAAADEAAKGKQPDDVIPRGVQQPKTEGPLAGRVIGGIDKGGIDDFFTLLYARVDAVREKVDSMISVIFSAHSLAAGWAGEPGDERTNEIATVLESSGADGVVDILISMRAMGPEDWVKIFRARKGEKQ